MPFEFADQTVFLASIDPEDDRFRITTNPAVDDLASALDRVGLISPPVLRQRNTGYGVVCGFRRIAAARSLGWETLSARVLDATDDALVCARLAISENLSQRSLNHIETSRAVHLLLSILPDESRAFKMAGELGLPQSVSYLKKVAGLCRLPLPIQNGILSGDLTLPSAEMLSKLPNATAVSVSELLTALKLSLHKQRELIGMIQEISIREERSIESILQSPELGEIMEDPSMDIPRKAHLVRERIRYRRFPNLSEAQTAFDRLRAGLNLGEHASLKPPPGFESNRFTITFSFLSVSDLHAHSRTLSRLATNETLRELLESRSGK